MVDRCSCEGVASENHDLISEELLFLARFLADQRQQGFGDENLLLMEEIRLTTWDL